MDKYVFYLVLLTFDMFLICFIWFCWYLICFGLVSSVFFGMLLGNLIIWNVAEKLDYLESENGKLLTNPGFYAWDIWDSNTRIYEMNCFCHGKHCVNMNMTKILKVLVYEPWEFDEGNCTCTINHNLDDKKLLSKNLRWNRSNRWKEPKLDRNLFLFKESVYAFVWILILS